jgi:hypothetical protein
VEETGVATVVEIPVETVVATEAATEATVLFVEEIGAIVVQADIAKEAAHGEATMADEDGAVTKALVDQGDMEVRGSISPLTF